MNRQSSLRLLNVAEAGTFHQDIGVPFTCCFDNFMPNMLTFAVTIGPDHELTGIPSLLCKILRDVLLVLRAIRVNAMGPEHYLSIPKVLLCEQR